MGAVEHAHLDAELALDRPLDACAHTGRIAVAAEHDVAALEVRGHLLAPERLVEGAEPGHRHEVVATDVDPAQQRHMANGHGWTLA